MRAAAAALLLSVASLGAEAAGLGRLTVLSSLGQPFRGEIDLVSVKKEEVSSLTARMASPDAFRQADLPFTAYVSNLKLSLEKRPNGDPYVKITAAQPLSEPFIDFLVELGWTSGRLVRAYTALLDPPVVADEQSDTKVQSAPAPAEVKPDAVAKAPEAAPAKSAEPPVETRPRAESAPIQQTPEPAPAAEASAAAPPAQTSASAAPPASAADYKVKRGDTLGKIARTNKPADLSLEQMLVLLYRSNPDAFEGKNMNRLRAGKVLRIPDSADAANLAPEEARKEVKVQAANWNAYREKLAAMTAAAPADDLMPGPSAAGKVTTKLEEKTPAPAEPAKEVLKLSKGEGTGAAATGTTDKDGKSQQRIRTLEEEVAAKGKAVADANERIGQLEKQIKDMQALVEMKSKSAADLKPPVAPTPSAPTPPAPAPAAKAPPAGEMPSLVPSKSEATPPPAPAPAPAEPAAVTPPPAETPIPPPPPPRKPFVPTPPPPPPSLVDVILGEPLYLAGGAAVLAALGGLGFMSWKRRRNAGGATEDATEDTAAPVAAAAEAEDEATQPVVGDGSDPLAEAEVFLIYGRDAQAEERLREAIVATPTRYELHSKLLEIYAKRGDPIAFEDVAKDLQMGTNAEGELWEKAAKLGYQLDPGNPRYASGRPDEDDTQRTFPGSESTVQMSAFPGDAGSNDLDFNLGFDEAPSGASSTDIDLGELGEELSNQAATSTDIDLSDLAGSGSDASDILDPSKTLITTADEILPTTQMEAFDPTASLGVPDTGDLPTLPGIPAGSAAAAADDLGLDFDLGDATAKADDEAIAGGSGDIDGMSFDLSTLQLDSPPLEDTAAPAAPASAAPDLDLSGISLELGETEASPEAPVARDEKWYDVQTKFDLAKAYQEMGDREGAREILDEVIAEGDPEQRTAAQALMGTLQ